jgi:tRNA wybutosine-synthesizing protein 3
VLVIALAKPGSKKESIMLGKWHEKIVKTDVENAINDWKKLPNLYLLAQSPILHITTPSLESATHLRNIGEAGGFKYSSLRSIKFIGNQNSKNKTIENQLNFKITVELLSTERLNVPIGYDGKIIIDDKYLDFLIRIANDVIEESQKKVLKLGEILKNRL